MISARPVLRALVVAGCGLVLAGCSFEGSVTATDDTSSTGGPPTRTGAPTATSPDGSPAPAGSTTPTTSSSPPAPAGDGGTSPAVERCHSGDLVGRLVTEDSSAGHRHAQIELRNISGSTCHVRGYGGVQLIDEYQQHLATEQDRVSPPAPATVTVGPGGTTTSELTWAVIPGAADADSGPCQPEPTTLSVIPPDETEPLALAWSLGPVCQGGTIQQQAYR
ncbi:DUF4232 domain-containing protein [Modestobacter roseus]|uniref:Uncharacterized protein DUF4232 n=1 Tax=Modestobacter roseus TaxID=1181884 RepID=A0A562IVS0_9ACTN|nr:DUF4232 domain-containing protein [Modestobacter roseus]MQA34706.1 DUF4232 domain-containing protein [Modestobacter roseus]TWH75131.1 uncharacterized protein DUF4232 [Modestobacter roseus]